MSFWISEENPIWLMSFSKLPMVDFSVEKDGIDSVYC